MNRITFFFRVFNLQALHAHPVFTDGFYSTSKLAQGTDPSLALARVHPYVWIDI